MFQNSTLFGTTLLLLKTVPSIRLKGKADPDSSFFTELSTAVGIVFFIPYLGVKKLFGFLKPKQLYIKGV